jgi:hypothetical protein
LESHGIEVHFPNNIYALCGSNEIEEHFYVSTQRGLRPKRLLAMEQAELNCNLY